MARMAVVLLACLIVPGTLAASEGMEAQANPIRKVVTMLQKMVETVEAEGKKEEELFEKYMCYCKSGRGELEAGIAASEAKISDLASSTEAAEGELAQLKEDLSSHRSDRDSAKQAMAEATTRREKEAAAFAAESAEYGANLAAMKKAVAAIEKGMGGAFLQTNAAQVVKQLVEKNQDLFENDREEVMAFLEQGSEESSGEIVGILKTMIDEMTKGLADAEAAEKQAIADYEGLMAAKTKEIDSATAAIEDKVARIGEAAVALVNIKEDLEDTQKQVAEDSKFLADLDNTCATRKKEFEAAVKLRQEELLALADTIKMLNSDEALELFKKTLPGSSSLLQIKVTQNEMVHDAKQALKSINSRDARLEFILLALHGKKVDMSKVIKMIDDMVALLTEEQASDDEKKEYCEAEFDTAEDEGKAVKRSLGKLAKAIAENKDAIDTLKTEIEALSAGIAKLDKQVARATENRQEENEDFKMNLAANTAAVELIGMAKNRMQKFYNPKLYKPPAKREITEEERLTLAAGGTIAPVFAQIQEHVQHKAAKADPGPPPTLNFGGSKGQEATGVLAMMDSILQDLDKEMTEAEAEEKDAQADYEKMMKDSAAKRAEDTKHLSEKQAAKADMEADLEKAKEDKMTTSKQYFALKQYIATLHGECDWLLQYFDARKEARDSEIDAMGKAKSVLMGADYSLVQTKAKKNLRH
eukprot:gnl/TRDRNA2_/TRDRNA2_177942_c4_seq2.p1 gnl/TRDRNA2_/TRDRNA2_177942_c4~~gnl/TRDRNA2_/TRDRNA2_177942_c4_seq2.p1  ORF type:complete len:701 (+),score=291.57 gnl/TRDRNA2_/TRDRNA2_177942_c4_seq2:76-2178(+)